MACYLAALTYKFEFYVNYSENLMNSNYFFEKRVDGLDLISCSFVAVVNTSSPTNEAELQLYRVLQKASLLAYYDTLLEMGNLKN